MQATLFGFVNQIELHLRGWALGHLTEVATALTAAILVIYGDDINKFVKVRVRPYHFVIRTTVFVILCSFGYGFLAYVLTPAIAKGLRYFGDTYLVITMVGAFVGIGMLGERKRYM